MYTYLTIKIVSVRQVGETLDREKRQAERVKWKVRVQGDGVPNELRGGWEMMMVVVCPVCRRSIDLISISAVLLYEIIGVIEMQMCCPAVAFDDGC